MHIALAADRQASIGGIETHIATLAEDLCQMGFKISVLFPKIVEPDLFAYATDAGAHLIELDKSAWVEYISDHGIDLFHAHSAKATEIAAAVGRQRRLPVVATIHGPGQHIPYTINHMGVIFVSQEIAKAKARPNLRSVVIENGVNVTRFRPKETKDDSRLRILYLGRVGPSKQVGITSLVRAVRNLPQVTLRFASTWTPHQPPTPTTRPEQRLPWADLVFSTGRGVREAMAAGAATFVLGTYMDGLVTPTNVQSLATVNFSGRLTMQLPETHRIQATIREILDRPSYLQSLKQFGRDYAVTHFDSRQMARLTAQFYRSISGA